VAGVETRYPDGTMPGWVSIPEIILLLVVILLIFGPKRVPEIGRSLGKGMREFKNSITGKDEPEQGTELPPPSREQDTTV
jgi:sec-independent protein translocase protein TatA